MMCPFLCRNPYRSAKGVDTELDYAKSETPRRYAMMTASHAFTFAVELKGNLNAPIGFLGMYNPQQDPPEMFLIFSDKHWGKGYASEALKAFLETYWGDFAKRGPSSGEEGKDIVQARVYPSNVGSAIVFKRCGFEYLTATDADDSEVHVYQTRRPV